MIWEVLLGCVIGWLAGWFGARAWEARSFRLTCQRRGVGVTIEDRRFIALPVDPPVRYPPTINKGD